MVIANAVGLILFLYLFWKRLKEDYHYERIFNSASIILLFFLLAFVVSKYFLQPFWFWIEVVGLLIGFAVVILRIKLKFFESLEALYLGMLPWMVLFFLSHSIRYQLLSSFLAFWVGLICLALFFFFDATYKKFNWYRSGRVGFAGLATVGIFFLIRSVVSVFFPDTISFVGRWDIYLSTSFAFLNFLLLFKLSKTE